jgi:hypothetical protein
MSCPSDKLGVASWLVQLRSGGRMDLRAGMEQRRASALMLVVMCGSADENGCIAAVEGVGALAVAAVAVSAGHPLLVSALLALREQAASTMLLLFQLSSLSLTNHGAGGVRAGVSDAGPLLAAMLGLPSACRACKWQCPYCRRSAWPAGCERCRGCWLEVLSQRKADSDALDVWEKERAAPHWRI